MPLPWLSSALVLLFLIQICYSGKQICFRASKSVSRSIPSNSFSSWFAKDTTPATILSLNPGLDRVEQISAGRFKGYLAPIRFPGVTVRSILDFQVHQEDLRIDVTCEQGSLEQSFEGPKVFVGIVSKILPSIASRTSFILNTNEAMLTNQAQLEISFNVPSWFPLNQQSVEESGSKTIQSSMEKDLDGILDKIISEYLRYSSLDLKENAAA